MDSFINGYPRLGRNRELKFAIEKYWRGELDRDELNLVADEVQQACWAQQESLSEVLVDGTMYDHVLDMAVFLNMVPDRFRLLSQSIDRYFAMARGNADYDIEPLEMTKWFDTNYHCLVPVHDKRHPITSREHPILRHVTNAVDLGYAVRAYLVGPYTFAHIAGVAVADIVPSYMTLLMELQRADAQTVVLDEPVLALGVKDVSEYTPLIMSGLRPNISISIPFGVPDRTVLRALGQQLFSGDAIGLDFSEHPSEVLNELRRAKVTIPIVEAGIVNGRNVWPLDRHKAARTLDQIRQLDVCSQLRFGATAPLWLVPHSTAGEDAPVSLAFADEKIEEIALHETIRPNGDAVSKRDIQKYVPSAVIEAVINSPPTRLPYEVRVEHQADLNLPLLPTTTIGSLPQTNRIRRKRAKGGESFEQAVRDEMAYWIDQQEAIGLDVFVHGEFERNDMVQYFAENLTGFYVTKNGWVQSYGTRCTRPPILYGQVERPKPITVRWWQMAQQMASQYGKPVKGMLTGPTTILQWSFVRDDAHRSLPLLEVALALKEEVRDLVEAGCRILQIDEPALREGLPAPRELRGEYLGLARTAFHLVMPSEPEVQVHTHMCYSDFGDVYEAIEDLDADVISLESARSGGATTDMLHKYPRQAGPGVYDIHSPRVPAVEEMVKQLKDAHRALGDRLWVNPDCGLKTRDEPETVASLKNMVRAAQKTRDWIESRKEKDAQKVALNRRKR